MSSGIYSIRNLKTGWCYIGQSVNLKSRKKNHFVALRHGRHHCDHLQRAFGKYGEKQFDFVILEECDIANLTEREQFWMDWFEIQQGIYNSAPAAGSVLGIKRPQEQNERRSILFKGHSVSEETRHRISVAGKGRKASLQARAAMSVAHMGGICSVETCKKISDALKGKVRSPKHCLSISLAATGRKATPEAIIANRVGQTGRKMSQESIEKTRQANIGRVCSEEKKVKISASLKARNARV